MFKAFFYGIVTIGDNVLLLDIDKDILKCNLSGNLVDEKGRLLYEKKISLVNDF